MGTDGGHIKQKMKMGKKQITKLTETIFLVMNKFLNKDNEVHLVCFMAEISAGAIGTSHP